MTEGVQFWIYQLTFWAAAATVANTVERREYFGKKALFCIGLLGVICLFYQQYVLPGSQIKEIILRIFSTVLMVFFLYYCWKMTKTMAVYNTVWAISIWQLTRELWQVAYLRLPVNYQENLVITGILMCAHFSVILAVCYRTIASWMPIDRKNWVGPRQLGSAICILVIVIALANTPAMRSVDLPGDWLLIFLSQCFCVVILYMQNEIFKRSFLKEEMNTMQALLQKEQDQYQLTRENIALINQKCHDLKHQIRAIQAMNREEREAYLEELEDTIEIYEAMVKTGNEVLDTILTDKSLYCKDRGIKVSCVVDGSQMDFIRTTDLYALLGNAIDNAMEAVEKFQTIEKRQIDVMIYRQQNFLILNIVNPVKVEPVYDEEGELPVTIKKDKAYHGFGMRSMKYILEKYDGTLSIHVEDGCFDLKMLIPIPA